MTRLYKTLSNQIGQKITIYRELIDLLQEEWDCIVDYSLEEVQAILKKKEILTLKMQVLEENRVKVIAKIAKKLDVEPESLTLKNLLELHKHPLNSKLAAQRKTLLAQIDSILHHSAKTKNLVDYSSLSINKSLVFLHRSLDSADAPYGANGHKGGGKTPCRMLSTEG